MTVLLRGHSLLLSNKYIYYRAGAAAAGRALELFLGHLCSGAVAVAEQHYTKLLAPGHMCVNPFFHWFAAATFALSRACAQRGMIAERCVEATASCGSPCGANLHGNPKP